MRLIRCSILLGLAAIAAHAGIVSRDWADGKMTLKLDDGSAEIEWITPIAFRVARSWGAAAPSLPKISHEAITPELEDAAQTMTMRTRYVTLVVDRADMTLHVRASDNVISTSVLERSANGIELRLRFAPNDRVYGLADLAGGSPASAPLKLNIRGEKFERSQGFFINSGGYGIFVRSSEKCSFNLTDGVVHAPGAQSIDYLFYYGPSPKEILEQHAVAAPSAELSGDVLALLSPQELPKPATPIAGAAIDSWESLDALVLRLNHASLSGVLFPALDIESFAKAPQEIRRRAADLAAMLPIVFRSSGEAGIDSAERMKWRPYVTTYLREAYDRGYPLIRPLVMQFSRDPNADKQADVFMLGDEVLLAPVVSPGAKRRIDLPRGNWTDFRTNIEYRGNQTVEVDAPAGQVPAFVRNGWIVPLEIQSKDGQKMELHYFPDLGGEFFLWEPNAGDNSQFHAAPADDYLRVEIESRARRTYEWVLHHTKAPREVAEEAGAYQKANAKEALKPGMWWHDASRNDLHVMLRCEPGTDRIVNISF